MGIRSIESQKRFEHAQSLVAGGMTIGKAVKEAGISMGTWYDKNKKSKKQLRATMGKKARPKFVDLERAEQAPRIAIVIATPDALKDILKGVL